MKIVELKKKIPKILILPLMILLAFSVYSGLDKLEEKAGLKRVSEYMQFSIIASGLIHELQKERGYSSGYIASNTNSFFDELKEQRKNSDKGIKNLRRFLNNFDSSIYSFSFKTTTKLLLESLNNIDIQRRNVNKLLNYKTIDYYTENINILLALIEQVITIDNDSKLVVLTQSYITLMQIKEKAGIERALISKVLGTGKLSDDEFYKFG
ncbi:MAG: nitrate- and nitrite sensing domain-containing protein, partial [Sulfurimonas sp.]|nr:nitrate- and nitrite sensing domain-containing protein [Sulfurimonas sp.]